MFIGSGNDSDSLEVSGRDDSLLKILAKKMNFRFRYFDVQTLRPPDNGTQLGEVGLRMLEERVSCPITPCRRF